MNSVLKSLKENGLLSIRGEFEAEGMDEFDKQLLNNLSSNFALYKTIKLGGVEAISDFKYAVLSEASTVIFPMVESRFGVKKIKKSIRTLQNFISLLSASNIMKISKIEFAINIESKVALDNLSEIFDDANGDISTVVVGRVDLADSLGHGRNNIEKINTVVKDILKESKSRGFKTSLGGGISISTIPFIDELIKEGLLDYLETRKLVFKVSDIVDLKKSIKGSVDFELKYLDLKSKYEKNVLDMLENRWNILKSKF